MHKDARLDSVSIALKWSGGPEGIISELREFLAENPPVRNVREAFSSPATSEDTATLPDEVVCLECGWTGKILRRHLMAKHGWSARDYIRVWNLANNLILTAPSYSNRCSLRKKSKWNIGLAMTIAVPRGISC
jgi:predicted transcriptional regulator